MIGQGVPTGRRWRSRSQAFVERIDGLQLTMLKDSSGQLFDGFAGGGGGQ